MGGSSADIEALLVDVNDVDNPTPGTLPAIFQSAGHRLVVVRKSRPLRASPSV